MRLNTLILSFLIASAAFASEQTELEKQLETLREAYVIPGISAAIYKDGQVLMLFRP